MKDAIEAMGVPHPEVDVVLVNDVPASFFYLLLERDRVEVYPARSHVSWPESYSFGVLDPAPDKFILDVHLGKLAKALRMLGFDTLYRNDYTDRAIAQVAAEEERVVLTRDVGLLKQKVIRWGYWLRSQHLAEQLTEVIRHFQLKPGMKPFERCLACNGKVVPVSKESVVDALPPKTKRYFNEFFQCPSCQRVYWKGSHYDRMQAFVKMARES